MAKTPLETKRIVIVEDDLPIRQVLSNRLSGLGLEVFGVAESGKAVDAIAAVKPHLVVLDLHMHEGPDGFIILENLRSHWDPLLKSLPVLVLTNLWTNLDKKRAEEFEIIDYLIKAENSLEEIQNKILKALQ